MHLIVEFWGTRSLIPLAASLPRQYGGHTACVSISGSNGCYMVFDCGTGAIPLGTAPAIVKKTPFYFFISQYSWDRLQGLPFFQPLFDRGFQAEFYAPSTEDVNPEHILEMQMRYEFFPVSFRSLPCQRRCPHQTYESDRPVKIDTAPSFPGTAAFLGLHPHLPVSAFRLNTQKKSLAYAVHIDWENPYPQLKELSAFLQDMQLFITCLPVNEMGWNNFWRVQKTANLKHIVFSDYSPYLDDAFITSALQAAQAESAKRDSDIVVQAAYDNLKIIM